MLIQQGETLDRVFEIIFQNEDFLIINKQNGLPTQRNNDHQTSVEEQLTACGKPFNLLPRAGIVHRLDKDTTGLLVIARNENSLSLLQKLFKARKVSKVYLSLHRGTPASADGEIKFYQVRSFPRGRAVRMTTAPCAGKLVNLRFGLVASNNAFSLLRVLPQTGRPHQLRLAFQKIQFPIYNDPLYNPEPVEDGNGQYLHAWKLSFPFKGELFSFEAPLPAFFKSRLAQLQITLQ